ncbi:MAG TPA: Rieske 2Fe-2S domain-containing protein [Candidatus Solibacter sp.]|jgi:nitrite reductase/ring-hydroxylating ferredoxin subunit
MSPVTRRGWLQSTALFAGAPCACLAQASNDCCSVPEVAADIRPGLVTLDLARTPGLKHTGTAVKIVDVVRKLQILVARPTAHTFVALDQKCTHGGGALTYVHKHKHIYCTCWGHAKFALDGSVLRWPNKQTPRPLRAYAVERKGSLLEIRVEGLA